MNRFEIVFSQIDEASAVIVPHEPKTPDVAEIRAISEETDSIEELMRVSREISEQTRWACFTTS